MYKILIQHSKREAKFEVYTEYEANEKFENKKNYGNYFCNIKNFDNKSNDAIKSLLLDLNENQKY